MQLSDDNYAILADLYRRNETVRADFPDHVDCSDTCVYAGRESTYCPTAR